MVLSDILTVCETIKDILANNEVIAAEVNERNLIDNATFNSNPNNTPWIGIYPDSSAGSMIPETLGPQSFINDGSINIFIQDAVRGTESKKAAITVNKLLKEVVNIFETNPKLNGVVRRITGMSAEYSYLSTDDDPNLFYPMVKLNISYEVKNS